MGAKRIILLGFDMQPTNGLQHHFGEHPNKVKSPYATFLAAFKTIAKQLPSLDLEIINSTRITALTCFEKMNINQIL